MKPIKVIILIILGLLLSFPVDAKEAQRGKSSSEAQESRQSSRIQWGTVMRVKDGDTVVIRSLNGGQYYICRLYGIDAPEKTQRNGAAATKALKTLVLGHGVNITTTGDKTYGREVCILRIGEADINLEMVKLGYAWAYRKYLKRPYASEYIEAESEARARRLGLWQDNNPMPPWEFRNK